MTKTAYKLVDKATGIILAEQVSNEELNDLKETYQDIGYEVDLVETAAGGSTSASSIAVNLSGDTKQPMQLMKSFMNNFNSKVKNRIQHKKYRDFFIKIDEAFDIESVFSRLASMEKAGQPKRTEGTTFGIEDDNGNIMKVTVRADQAQEFEQEVARYLADIKMNVENLPASKTDKNISMAELLFNMKDKFDIIDVEFPKIPGDVIYNADKATYNTGNMDMGAMGAEGELEDNPMDPLDLTDFEEPQSPEGEMGDMDMGMEDELGDAESVEDFPEETEGSDEGSILAKVIDMLKAQAESEVERAKAEAEKARAEQARYTAQATQFAMKDQEEQLRYELEMDEQKKREKEAKKMADMAKHRISKTLSVTSGISEADEGATPAMVMRQRQMINARYAVEPTDTPEDRQFKAKQRAEAMREWTSRYRQALNKERYDRVKAEQEKRQGKQSADPRQQKQQQQQPNAQQPNAQQGGTNEI